MRPVAGKFQITPVVSSGGRMVGSESGRLDVEDRISGGSYWELLSAQPSRPITVKFTSNLPRRPDAKAICKLWFYREAHFSLYPNFTPFNMIIILRLFSN